MDSTCFQCCNPSWLYNDILIQMDPIDLYNWSVKIWYGHSQVVIEEHKQIFERTNRLPGVLVVLLAALAGQTCFSSPAARLYSLCSRTFHCTQCCLSSLRLLLWGTFGAQRDKVVFSVSLRIWVLELRAAQPCTAHDIQIDRLFQQLNFVTLTALPSHFHVLFVLMPSLWCSMYYIS